MQDSVLTLEVAAAAPSSLAALGTALLVGSVFILPALYYLIYSFQKKRFDQESGSHNRA